MKQQDMITNGIKVLILILVLVLSSWYFIHMWKDCLNENSIFTCMRMLTK
jgi:hypothetical protein